MEAVKNDLGLSRAECEAAVKRPGQFEGEQPWVPYFWEFVLNGCGDETVEIDGDSIELLTVDPGDVAVFPELEVGQRIALTATDQGFVVALDATAVLKEVEKQARQQSASED